VRESAAPNRGDTAGVLRRAVAEMIVRGRSESVDVGALCLDRFARGEAIHETMVL
jgi:hypothetical protein